MNLRVLLPVLAVAFTACPGPTPTPDGGTAQTPIVTSILPTSGPVSGGTAVTINGANFASGATVSFDSVLASNVVVETDKKITAVTPAQGAGVVSVTVTNPGGKSNTLAGAFTYTGTTTNKVISEAVLQNPAETTDTSGAANVSVTVVGHVQVANVTAGTGQGAGVKAQVGFASTVGATPAQSDFTWTDAIYVGDVDGPAAGDKLRDSYSGAVSLPSPTTGSQAIYFVTARFSVDDGQSWTMADRDGSSNGVLTTQLAKVTVSKASVDWCKLGGEVVEAPPTVNLRGGAMGPTIYGQVYKLNVTNSAGAGANIKGELGYGPAGVDPSTWTWIAATFNTDTGGGANDEWKAQLPNPGAGAFKFAFRFNHSDGPWSYCDADGLANNGFTEDQAGTLTVTAAGVDSCKLQFPGTLQSYEGRPTDNVYGIVYVQGLTEASGAAPGVEGQVGFGASSAAPTDPSWIWSATTFNMDEASGGGEEWMGRLTGPTPGSYAYAYRFRVDGGSWTYCDKNGSSDGIQAGELGALTANPFDVSSCSLESANSLQTVLPNTTSQPYTAVVTVPTLTDAAGQGTPLTVQIGRGSPGTDPSTWSGWAAATYSADVGAADRYSATLQAGGTVGSQAVAYRVQVGSRPFVYCDLDGSQNGFQQAQAGRLTVASALIQSCKFQLAAASGSTTAIGAIASGSPMTVTARTLIPGVSSTAGASPNLRMQIGIGPDMSDATTSNLWGWKDATFSADVSATGEDEFALTFSPAYTGGRMLSARASLDGVSWTYCDPDGSANGYSASTQWYVNVTNHATFCNTQFPGVADGGTVIYGRVYYAGITPDGGAPITAQLGLGAETADPGVAWSWQAATFNVTNGNDNEYQSRLPADAGNGLRYAFRYSLDGGDWCFGDLDGSQNGFSGGSNIGLVAP